MPEPESLNPLDPSAGTGGPLPQPVLAAGDRRQLTVLSYDLVGSTELLVMSDPEDFHAVISEFRKVVREIILRRGGTIDAEIGDGGTALFPTDIDAKDAASAAINAGLEIARASSAIASKIGIPQLRVRVGIATSIAIMHEHGRLDVPGSITALSLAMAARLQALAEPGTVLVSQQTRSLARRSHKFNFLGTQTVKGFPEPEDVWRALSRRNDFDRYLAFGRVNSQMVNRDHELREISRLWQNVVKGNGAVISLEGEAGMGKSRILQEIRRLTRADRQKMLLFQCHPNGSRNLLGPLQLIAGTAPGPNQEAFSRAALNELLVQYGINNREALDVFSFLMGVADTTTERLKEASVEVIQNKLIDATQMSAAELCAGGPVFVAIEDIHWIDPTSLQMLAEIARMIPNLPMLLVTTSRGPAPSALAELPNVARFVLGSLDASDTRKIIESRWPKHSDSRSPKMLDMVEQVSGGVPLLIEEICEWAAAHPDMAADRMAATAKQGGVSVLETVLSARLETLGPAKDVIRAGAAAGIRFSVPLLREMLPELDEASIESGVDALVDAGFIFRSRSSEAASFGFRHILIQETVYATLLRKTRQTLHRRLFVAVQQDRVIAPWLDTTALAEQAERAGMLEDAAELFVSAGKNYSARSSMVEARQLLDHAIELIERTPKSERREQLRLSALSALGPVLIAAEGPASAEARKLYEDGVALARRRPSVEQAMWFPIYWGWWFTGTDVENQRAREILKELKDVRDSEVQLQIRHCIWAIDFYLGRHDSCLTAIDTGLPMYDVERARMGRTLFGGHDARVCGLSHKGLSLWLTGKPASGLRAIKEARVQAQQTEHVGSIVHACLNEAMFHCYRRDFASLKVIVPELRQLAESNGLRSLTATADIFDGWRVGMEGEPWTGQKAIERGLAAHAELQTPEDYIVYCDMLAELMGKTGSIEKGLALLDKVAGGSEGGEYKYWLPALHHRRSLLMTKQDPFQELAEHTLEKSMDAAKSQSAVALLLPAYETARRFFPTLAERYRSSAELAYAGLEQGIPLYVNPPKLDLDTIH